MSRRFKRFFSDSAPATPESRYAKMLTSRWLLRLVQSNVDMNRELLGCFSWATGKFDDLLNHVLDKANKSPRMTSVIEALESRLEDGDSEYIASCIDNLSRSHRAVGSMVQKFILAACQAVTEEDIPVPASFSRAKTSLKELFGLTDEAADLCEFVFIKAAYRPVDRYFEDELSVQEYRNQPLLADMLDCSLPKLKDALMEVDKLGIMEVSNHHLSLNENLIGIWQAEGPLELDKMFSQPLNGDTLDLTDFEIDRNDIAHVRSILACTDDSPVNILLYGAPGTGKTTFARSLARDLGIQAWAVASRDDDNDRDRRLSLVACSHITARNKGACVVVDEAERLLDTDIFGGGKAKDKAWLNSFLERKKQRIIWITNHVDHIDDAVKRRFSYSIFFKPLGKEGKKRIWQQVLSRHGVVERISAKQLARLIREHDVPTAMVEDAVNQAKRVYHGKKNFHAGLVRILSSYEQLILDGELREEKEGKGKKRKSDAERSYDINAISTSIPGAELVERCQHADRQMRKAKEIRPHSATMLFYGAPGTGKTALARHIARKIRRQCLVKRASDLIDPFVGMTEKKIAAAFRQAEKDGKVLVIDEVDSFLRSRELAQRSWEGTMVNEFLTCLDECRAFCICTTNLRENIDPAAMRRFAFKVEFDYAKPDQVLALYKACLGKLCKGGLTPEQTARLKGMTMLAPGDFHTVRAQHDSLFNLEGISHDKLIDALAGEQRLKLDKKERSIGFSAA